MGYIFDTTPKFLPSLLVSQKQSSTIPKTLQNIFNPQKKIEKHNLLANKNNGFQFKTSEGNENHKFTA